MTVYLHSMCNRGIMFNSGAGGGEGSRGVGGRDNLPEDAVAK